MPTVYNKVVAGNTVLVDLSQDTVTQASHIVAGHTGHLADGTQVQGTGGGGTYQAKTNISPTTSSQTIIPDNGYDALSSVQINAMPTGTAGTPTATKGTVSNHSISVTPSVTNATGYITGGTKTGTAVTVSASELVSGSETKTANGTYDVTNLAELVVNVSGGKNGQLQSRVARTSQTTYTDMGFEITVSKAGKYNVYWAGYRSSTSGTSGAQIYINGTAYGSAQTTFNSSYANCQTGAVSNVTLAVKDKVTIRARARNSSSYMYIFNLAIIEV